MNEEKEQVEEWKRLHGIKTWERGTYLCPWSAWREPNGFTGSGPTEKAAIERLATLLGIKL
jgi:hypothetical protein